MKTRGPLFADGHAVRRADGSTFAVCDTPDVSKSIVEMYEMLEILTARVGYTLQQLKAGRALLAKLPARPEQRSTKGA